MVDVYLYAYKIVDFFGKWYANKLLKIDLDCCYHTSVVIRDEEYFFGPGIISLNVHSNMYHFGELDKKIHLGEIDIDECEIESILDDLSSFYTPKNYNLLKHNCVHFCDSFLTKLGFKDKVPKEYFEQMEKARKSRFIKFITWFI